MWIGSDKVTPRPSYKRQITVFITFILILFTTIFLIKQNPVPNSASEILIPKNPQKSRTISAQSNPYLEHSNGTEIIWQIPNSPKVALFIAHGCTIRAFNFWDKSPNCPHCNGLPEERIFVAQALELKIAVLTISSLGECWSFEKEMENVEWIIKNWVEKNKLQNIPLLGLGASSGGYFLSALATKIKFESICIMIAEGVFENMDIPAKYPPTIFIHMPKDKIRVSAIRSSMDKLMEKGIDVKEIRCMNFPLNARFLAERISGLDLNFAVRLIEVFREKGFLDDKGYLKQDGRATPWKEALMEKKIMSEKFELVHHVEEELNLAYGYHEFTSLKNDEIFEWFESHMKSK